MLGGRASDQRNSSLVSISGLEVVEAVFGLGVRSRVEKTRRAFAWLLAVCISKLERSTADTRRLLLLDLLLQKLVSVSRKALQLMQAAGQPWILWLLVLVVGLRHYSVVEIIIRELQEDSRVVLLRRVRSAGRGGGSKCQWRALVLCGSQKSRTGSLSRVLWHAVLRALEHGACLVRPPLPAKRRLRVPQLRRQHFLGHGLLRLQRRLALLLALRWVLRRLRIRLGRGACHRLRYLLLLRLLGLLVLILLRLLRLRLHGCVQLEHANNLPLDLLKKHAVGLIVRPVGVPAASATVRGRAAI